MFTRHVTMKLKANSSAELTRIIEKELIPLLRRQEGFRHEDTSITPELSEAVVNSYWDTKEYAAAYDRTGYPELLRLYRMWWRELREWRPLRFPVRRSTRSLPNGVKHIGLLI